MKSVCLSALRTLINPVCQSVLSYRTLLIPLLFAAGLSPQQLLAADAPGFIPGEFAVSPGGAATYNIPIEVPPGTASMQPELSLQYNSQGRNGLLGVGWSLGGLSSISRCQATIAQDGFNGGVRLDSNDRFCLDGRRLVAINGVDGGDGAEYRTEIDGFARIISYGQSGSGPTYWKMWTKSGRIIEYGNTSDSSLEAQGKSSILQWSVNKIADAASNYLNITYIEDPTIGERRPSRIDYAGNDNAGVSPQLSVRFNYAGRTDAINGYMAGSKITTSKRLASIKTYANEALVKEYRLGYDYSNASKRSRITEITECSAQYCKSATTFTWQDRELGLNAVARTSDSLIFVDEYGPRDDFMTGDFDGDGRDDLVRFNYDNPAQMASRVFLGKENGGFNILPDVNINSQEWSGILGLAQDYDGDGYTDIYGFKASATGFIENSRIMFSNGDGTFSPGQEQPINNPVSLWQHPGDINGDGLADVVAVKRLNASSYYPTNSLVTLISNGDGTFDEVLYPMSIRTDAGVYLGALKYLRTGDFNGDGLTDVVIFSSEGDRLRVFLSKGDGTYAEKEQMTNTVYASYRDMSYGEMTVLMYPGDFNGDGITDLFSISSDSKGLITFFGRGDGAFDEYYQLSSDPNFIRRWVTTYNLKITDFNADGLPDISYKIPDQEEDKALITNGDGTYTLYDDLLSINYNSSYRWTGDFDGDGQGDMLLEQSVLSGGVFEYGYFTMSNGIKPDLINSITDGLGDRTQISYSPITDNSIYTKGSGATPGIEKDIQAAVYVVAQVDSDNGIGGQNRTTFKYGGLKVNTKGRGSLGFAWREETSLQTGIVKRIEYRQDFPYVGMMSHTEIRHSDGALLNESTSVLADEIIHAFASGPDVHFPYISQFIEKKYELNNGALISTTTTTTSYEDGYGNPTRINVVVAGVPWNENKTTVNAYRNTEANWQIGKLIETTATYSNHQGTEVRSATYDYDGNGLLIQEVIEPNNIELRLQTDYESDLFGNQEVVTLSGANVEPRITTIHYDSQGTYPVSKTVSLSDTTGHTETYTYDAAFGVMTSLTGPNNLTTSWQYDGFGNKTREDRADGTWSTFSLGQCGLTNCPLDAPRGTRLHITTQSAGSTPETIFYDRKNRETRKVTTGFDGALVYEDTEYDTLGRVSGKSQPYFKGEGVHWTRTAYDDVNRVISMAKPTDTEPDPDPRTGGNLTSYSYNGLTISETNSLNQTTVRVQDLAGNPYQVTDNDGNLTTYLHSPTGNLLSTTDPAGNVITIGYNARGWKTSMSDPDMGDLSYGYNVYGELITQQDAKGQIVSIVYDGLGRMVQRTEPEGITTWVYDTAPYGIGKLAKVSAPQGYLQTITYDYLGRAITTSSTADSKTLSITTEYDEFGRVKKTTRPEGFVVENVYNAQGYLEAVRTPAALIGDYDALHLSQKWSEIEPQLIAELEQAQQMADELLAQASIYRERANYYRDTAEMLQEQNPSKEYLEYDRKATIDQLLQTATDLNDLATKLEQKAAEYQKLANALVSLMPTNWQQSWFVNAKARYSQYAQNAITKIETAYAAYQANPPADVWIPIDVGGITIFVKGRPGFNGGSAISTQERTYLSEISDWEAGTSTLLSRLAVDVRAQQAARDKYQAAIVDPLNPPLPDDVLTAEELLLYNAPDFLQTDGLALAELYISLAEKQEGLQRQVEYQRADYARTASRLSQTLAAYNDMLDQLQLTESQITFWHATGRDAAGRLTSSIAGNGLETRDYYSQATGQLTDIVSGFGYATPIRELSYEYNSLNNVTRRIDRVQGLSESFEYDGLNRLTRSTVSGTIAGINYDYNIDYSYDALGNITYKSDVGSYMYGGTAGNAGPHAVLSAGVNTYQYDMNGNMVQGAGRNITWSSFDKPIEFKKDGIVTDSFRYGPERARYLKVTPDSRTYYLGKAYERIESSSKIEHKYFIYADGELVAIHVQSTLNTGVVQPDETRYLHKDSLGSIDTITDGLGGIVDRMSYEPFGARRGGDWRVNTGVSFIPLLTNRGFTGHEHVDEMDLIHMNGRVYDPAIGRFISADPMIQSPYDQQSHNRYSYVFNNPLSYTDPSGFTSMGAWDTCEFDYSCSGDNDNYGSHDLGIIYVYASPIDQAMELSPYLDPISTSYLSSSYGESVYNEMSDWSSSAHNVLDVAGWVPGLGSVASVIDSAIYAYEGDWSGAAFAFAGVMGPAGKAFGKFGKVVKSADKLNPKLIQQNPRNLLPTQTKSEMSGSQVKRLTKNMKKNGYDQGKPVDAWLNPKTGRLEIQDGHHRTAAAIKAGIDMIPVRVWE